jgi:ectoine hydroxylase-related dioxygenase (phytanoyl-CoA dioxygenase family)
MTIAAELKPGSVLFYGGKLIHGGGANTTADVKRRVVASAFNPSFLVPEEAYPFVVPMDVARQMSSRPRRWSRPPPRCCSTSCPHC